MMNNHIFPFKIGTFNCFVIRDVDDWDSNALLIKTDQQSILVDTGNGDAVSNFPGMLLNRLKEADTSPKDINLVVLSHADFDHIGGVTDNDGNPAFPNARYVILREELVFWSSRPDRLSANHTYDEGFRKFVYDIPQARLSQLGDKLEPIERGTEVAPGICVISTPGHTPGHAVVTISSGQERLFYIGDLAHELEEVERPELCSEFDIDPAVAIETKRRIFTQAATEHILLMAYHLPFPGLGYISASGRGFHWQAYENPNPFSFKDTNLPPPMTR